MRIHHPWGLVLVIAGAASLAACEAADHAAELMGPDAALYARAAAAGPTQICHITNGAAGTLLLSVSERAVPGHLGHGDYLAVTYHRDPGTDPSLPETVVACEPPPGYSEDPCPVLVSSFSDDFSGPALDPAWQTIPGQPAPEICDGEACNEEDQAVAFRGCLAPASEWTVSFDFRAENDADREAYAVFSTGTPYDAATTTYNLGCDGGYGDGDTCGFIINLNGGTDVVGDVGLVVTGLTYTIVATGTSAGHLTASLYGDGGELLSFVEVEVDPFTLGAVGFVLGREPGEEYDAFLDDYSYTSVP